MTTVVISQPMYFPWVGFLGQMALADVLIWLDDAQFSKGSFTNRVQLKDEGKTQWMTIPLAGKGTLQPIGALAAAKDGWAKDHRQAIAHALAAAPFLADALDLFDAAMAPETLSDRIIASAEVLAEYLGILPATRLRSSALDIPGKADARVEALVLDVGGDHYVTGHGAANYMDHEKLEDSGITISYMDYTVVPWPQAGGDFTPFVTGLDAVAWCGRDARAHLPSGLIDWRDFVGRKAQR